MQDSQLIPAAVQALAGPETIAALGTMLATIPTEWVPSLNYLSGVIGTKWDTVRGTLLVRLCDYVQAGYKLPDIQAACRRLSDPEVQAACRFPDDWLAEFAVGLVGHRKDRLNRERIIADQEETERQRAYWASDEGRRQAALSQTILDEARARMVRDFSVPPEPPKPKWSGRPKFKE